MANPILNEKSFSKVVQRSAGEAGWAAPQAGQQSSQVFHAPINDGPVSPYKSGDTMTASGTASAALLLMLLLVASAMFGWSSVSESVEGAVTFPGWAMARRVVRFCLCDRFDIQTKIGPCSCACLCNRRRCVCRCDLESFQHCVRRHRNSGCWYNSRCVRNHARALSHRSDSRDRQNAAHNHWRDIRNRNFLRCVVFAQFVWHEHFVLQQFKPDEHRL